MIASATAGSIVMIGFVLVLVGHHLLLYRRLRKREDLAFVALGLGSILHQIPTTFILQASQPSESLFWHSIQPFGLAFLALGLSWFWQELVNWHNRVVFFLALWSLGGLFILGLVCPELLVAGLSESPEAIVNSSFNGASHFHSHGNGWLAILTNSLFLLMLAWLWLLSLGYSLKTGESKRRHQIMFVALSFFFVIESNDFLFSIGQLDSFYFHDFGVLSFVFVMTYLLSIQLRDDARVQVEKERFLEQLEQAEKAQKLGQLAGVVAHDFNNSLTPVLGFTDILLEDLEKGDPRSEELELVRSSALEARGLARALLMYGKRMPLAREFSDINGFLEEMGGLIVHSVPSNIKVEMALCKVPCELFFDKLQFQQLILNLVFNAVDAMPRGGKLGIITRREEDTVVIEIADTGSGIESGVIDKIYDPFFSTKSQEGVGMGLSTVWVIVDQHQGRIEVESHRGMGTTFTIVLPLDTT